MRARRPRLTGKLGSIRGDEVHSMVQAPAPAPTPSSVPGVNVDQVLRVDREHLIHPLSHPTDHATPLVLVRGEGAELIDANGKRYFDALSSLWNVNVGHGRADL